LRLEKTGGAIGGICAAIWWRQSTLAPSWDWQPGRGQAVYEAVSHGFVVLADEAGRTARPSGL
jgi:hypothetical protein